MRADGLTNQFVISMTSSMTSELRCIKDFIPQFKVNNVRPNQDSHISTIKAKNSRQFCADRKATSTNFVINRIERQGSHLD